MSSSRNNRFDVVGRRFRTELGALALAVVGATTISVSGIGPRAGATSAERTDLVGPEAALAAAVDQGADAAEVSVPLPVYSGEHGARVWRVTGADTATIDARTGALLEIEFGR
jgi:hypothetical protein